MKYRNFFVFLLLSFCIPFYTLYWEYQVHKDLVFFESTSTSAKKHVLTKILLVSFALILVGIGFLLTFLFGKELSGIIGLVLMIFSVLIPIVLLIIYYFYNLIWYARTSKAMKEQTGHHVAGITVFLVLFLPLLRQIPMQIALNKEY